jgi:hypothetical protein
MRATITIVLLLASLFAAGCGGSSTGPRATWVEENIAHDDVKISLGYRGQKLQPGGSIEPVALITREGKPVANAMVFVSLASAEATTDTLPDVPAVYEPTGHPPGAYAQANLPLPAGATECPVRFRIVLGETQQDWTRDIKIPLK